MMVLEGLLLVTILFRTLNPEPFEIRLPGHYTDISNDTSTWIQAGASLWAPLGLAYLILCSLLLLAACTRNIHALGDMRARTSLVKVRVPVQKC